MRKMKEIRISDIDGFTVGHAQDYDAVTGCTAIICPDGAVTAVDIRGGGPATRETPLLAGDKNTHKIHSVVFSGGSAYGLAASEGVMEYLEKKGIGYKVRTGIVPLVSSACIFDLAIGKSDIRPDFKMGYQAACNAMADFYNITDTSICHSDMQGNIGAGTGATVGKLCGPEFMMKSGLGIFALEHKGIKVGALAVVNALGDIIDEGNIVAGMLDSHIKIEKDITESNNKQIFADSFNAIFNRIRKSDLFDFRKENTTLVCVITNCDTTPQEAQKIACMAGNGLARAIRPVNTSADGDAVFCMNKGKERANIDSLGTMAAEATRKAILNAVKNTESIGGIISLNELTKTVNVQNK